LGKKDPRRIAEKLGLDRLRAHVLVCTAGSCASKSEQKQALKELRREVKAAGLKKGDERVLVTGVGCLGVCQGGPIALVWPDGTFYQKATPANLRRVLQEHVLGGEPVEELCIARPGGGGAHPGDGVDRAASELVDRPSDGDD